MRIKNHFHVNGFAVSLGLKQRLEATRKLPIHDLNKHPWEDNVKNTN